MNEVVAKRRQKTDPRPKTDASHSTPASFTLQTQKLIRALRMDVDRRWSRARNYRIDSLRSTTTSKLRIWHDRLTLAWCLNKILKLSETLTSYFERREQFWNWFNAKLRSFPFGFLLKTFWQEIGKRKGNIRLILRAASDTSQRCLFNEF